MSTDRPEVAIRSYFARRGHEVLSSKQVLFSQKRLFGRGLSNHATSYRVVVRTSAGDCRTYELAFDVAGDAVLENSGLKRYANGVGFAE